MKRTVLIALSIGIMTFATAGVAVAEHAPEELAEIAANAATPPPPVVDWQPIDASGGPDPRATIYFSDFEGSNGGLTGTLDWEWGTYAWVGGGGCSANIAPPPGPYSGTDMWGTVLNTCYNGLGNNSGYDTCVNGNPADDSILTLSVDLTGYTEAWLYWWEWFDLFLNWDWGEVRVNGTVVFQHCGGGYTAPTAWVMQAVNLTPYAGAPVTIEFHMMASSVVNYSGWFIDDLMVLDQIIPVELQTFTIE